MKFLVWIIIVFFSVGLAFAETAKQEEEDATREDLGGMEVYGDLTVFVAFPDASFPSFLDEYDASLNREDSNLYAEEVILRLDSLVRVRIDVFTQAFTSQLYVFDSSGELVAQASQNDPLILHNITEENQEYSLLVTSVYAGEGGEYTITVGPPDVVEAPEPEPEPELFDPPEFIPELPPEWGVNRDPVTYENVSDLEIVIGEETTNSLVDVEGIIRGGYRDGAPAESYTFEVVEEKRYLIDVYSSAFDTYIYVEGPNESFSSTNDDGGFRLNSRFIFEAESAGTARVIITMFDDDLPPGEYTILVQQLIGIEIPTAPTPATGFTGAEAVELELSQPLSQTLEDGDGQLVLQGANAGNADAYTITIPEGERVLVVVSRHEFSGTINVVVLSNVTIGDRLARGVTSIILNGGMGEEVTVVVYGLEGNYIIRAISLD